MKKPDFGKLTSWAVAALFVAAWVAVGYLFHEVAGARSAAGSAYREATAARDQIAVLDDEIGRAISLLSKGGSHTAEALLILRRLQDQVKAADASSPTTVVVVTKTVTPKPKVRAVCRMPNGRPCR